MDKRSDRLYSRAETDFMDKGECRDGVNMELFIAADYETNQGKLMRETAARVICGICVVRAECLEYAISHREQGLWGGTNDEERTIIKRQRRYNDGLVTRSAS